LNFKISQPIATKIKFSLFQLATIPYFERPSEASSFLLGLRSIGWNSTTKVRIIDMPRQSKRVQAKKQLEQRKPPPPTANAQNSPDPATQPFQEEDIVDISALQLPTRLDPINDVHHAAVAVGEHGSEQGNLIAGLTSAGLGNLPVASARSTSEQFLHPPPQPDHEPIRLHHQEKAPGSGNASTRKPAGLKTTGLESEAGYGDVDDDRSLLRSVGQVGSFDDIDVPEGESIPPPLPALVKFRAELKVLQHIPIAPRPVPPGIAIANRRGAVLMLPKTTGKGTGKKRGPYKEKFRESCTSTNPCQSTTISIKLSQPLKQFQQRSVSVSHPDPISEKYSTAGGQRSYTNMNREQNPSSDDDSFEEVRVIWSTLLHVSEDEKEVRGVSVLAS
jgi:hypothetical protein